MKTMSILALTFIAVSSGLSLAGEADHFTDRDKSLADSMQTINQAASDSLELAVNKANKKNGGCQERVLYKEVRKYFGNHFLGKLTRQIISDDTIEKRDISIYKSVYQDWKFYDGTVMASPIVKQFNMGMSAVMNIGGHEVGTDKLEHLFGQGFYYFTLNRFEKKSLYQTLYLGTMREMNDMGGSRWQTGIMSYGDLSANFNGFRFWNHILQQEDDILGSNHNVGPFVKCENNNWAKVKDIDFSEYFDDSQDESINCSDFATAKNLNNFTKRIHNLGYECPVDIKKRDDMKEKYGKFSKWIINSQSNQVTDHQVHFNEI